MRRRRNWQRPGNLTSCLLTTAATSSVWTATWPGPPGLPRWPTRNRAAPRLSPTQGDVTVASDCETAAVRLALDRFGRLDILVNNVGIAGAAGTAVDVDMEAWAKSLDGECLRAWC